MLVLRPCPAKNTACILCVVVGGGCVVEVVIPVEEGVQPFLAFLCDCFFGICCAIKDMYY